MSYDRYDRFAYLWQGGQARFRCWGRYHERRGTDREYAMEIVFRQQVDARFVDVVNVAADVQKVVVFNDGASTGLVLQTDARFGG